MGIDSAPPPRAWAAPQWAAVVKRTIAKILNIVLPRLRPPKRATRIIVAKTKRL
jgi:hypothetical protein